jgi:hypothetical protein
MSIFKQGLTPLQVSEFDLCAKSFIYFVDHYVKEAEDRNFPLEHFHRRWSKMVEGNDRVAVKLFRHSGLGTLSIAYTLWRGIFIDRSKALWVCNGESNVEDVTRRFNTIVSNLPLWLNPNPSQEGYSKVEFILKNGSIIDIDEMAVIDNPIHADTKRQDFEVLSCAIPRTYDLIVLNNAAEYWDNNLVWDAAYRRKLKNSPTKIIAQSYPHGDNGPFYKVWTNQYNEPWTLFQVDYTEHAFYANPDNVEKLKKDLGAVRFTQEVEGKFLSHKQITELQDSDIDHVIEKHMSTAEFAKLDTGVIEEQGFRIHSMSDEYKDFCADSYIEDTSSAENFPMPDTGKLHANWDDAKMEVYSDIVETLDEVEHNNNLNPGFNYSEESMDEATESIKEIWEDMDHWNDSGRVVAEYQSEPKVKKKAFKTLASKCKQFAEQATNKAPISKKTKESRSYIFDMMRLSGLVSEDQEEMPEDFFDEDDDKEDYRLVLISKIAEQDLPTDIQLSLDDENLLVNGCKTKISTQSIEMAFAGLAELEGANEALEKVGKLVRKKLSYVF